jgi:hypothetical protein
MKPLYLLPLLAFFSTFLSCEVDPVFNEIELDLETDPFYDIRLETSSPVSIYQSDEHRVVIRGRENDVNDVQVNVRNELLTIEEDHHADLVIEIYVSDLSSISNIGSSLVYGEDIFYAHNFWISQIGSGEIDFAVETDDLFVTQLGSGYIYVEGNTQTFDASIAGSGWLRSFNLESEFSDIRIEASGSAEVNVFTDLDVFINGSGDLYYKGHPSINAVITGSGSVIDAN